MGLRMMSTRTLVQTGLTTMATSPSTPQIPVAIIQQEPGNFHFTDILPIDLDMATTPGSSPLRRTRSRRLLTLRTKLQR